MRRRFQRLARPNPCADARAAPRADARPDPSADARPDPGADGTDADANGLRK